MKPAAIAVTSGEPAGIGPELCAALSGLAGAQWVVLGDAELLAARSGAPGGEAGWPAYAGRGGAAGLRLLHVPLDAPCRAGRLDPANAHYVLRLIERAVSGCLSGEFDAMVTAPVHKGVINDAGIPFTGHTEFLATLTATPQVVMMLVGGGMRVALATTHLALRDVAQAITRQALERCIRILHADLVAKFAIPAPRILVAGLNPHAGEGGHLGREEIEIIAPVLDRLRAEGMRLDGPLPADTLFAPHRLAGCDCVLAMYHDQGLPTLKYASFGHGVNVTLGLPIVRTSVDHGTALDLAGSRRADPGSLLAAALLALELAHAAAPART